jgi:hypothetical protein
MGLPVVKTELYIVNQTVGAASIAGSITTDGTIGVLSTSDIVDWDLILNDGTNIVDLTASNSVAQLLGVDLTASAANLEFNFSASDYGQLVFYNYSPGSEYGVVCIEANNNCAGDSNQLVLYDLTQDGLFEDQSLNGDQAIATIAPEPGTAVLWPTGIGLMILMRQHLARRRKRVWESA